MEVLQQQEDESVCQGVSQRDKGEFDGHSSSLKIAATHESSSAEAACYTIFQR